VLLSDNLSVRREVGFGKHLPFWNIGDPMKMAAQTSEAQLARIARWFSKDANALVYYARDGQVLPCTRDEQDQWLAECSRLVDDYLHRQKIVTRTWGVAFIALAFFLPTISDFLDDYASFLTVPFYLTMIASIVCPLMGAEFRYHRQIRFLRDRIERKLMWRENVPAPVRRHNSFRVMGLMSALSFWGYYSWIMMSGSKPTDFGLAMAAVAYILLLVLLWLVPRLDRAHIRQTGKWYRRAPRG
jgi:hypothetical protein